jgi:hypothetical protein
MRGTGRRTAAAFQRGDQKIRGAAVDGELLR